MLASICPLGERARRQRWSITAGTYVATSTLAGAAVGSVLAALGARAAALLDVHDSRPALGSLALLGAIGLAFDSHRTGLRLPGPRRQVNEDWLGRYRGWVYGTGFGAQLGAGFSTIVMVSAVYVVFAAAFLSGSVAAGALLGGVFGFVRAAPVLLTARVHDGGALRRFMASLDRALPPIHRTVLATQGLVVVLALAAFGAAS